MTQKINNYRCSNDQEKLLLIFEEKKSTISLKLPCIQLLYHTLMVIVSFNPSFFVSLSSVYMFLGEGQELRQFAMSCLDEGILDGGEYHILAPVIDAVIRDSQDYHSLDCEYYTRSYNSI